MTNYEKLKKAVKDGKFKRFIKAETLKRNLYNEELDEVQELESALFAILGTDIVDEDVKKLIVDSSIQLLAERLAFDNVFEFKTKKIETFDDFFEIMKEIIK